MQNSVPFLHLRKKKEELFGKEYRTNSEIWKSYKEEKEKIEKLLTQVPIDEKKFRKHKDLLEHYRTELVLSNIGIVIARLNERNIKSSDYEYYEGPCMFGISEAINTYDDNIAEFTTYAVFKIDKEILRQKLKMNNAVTKPVYFNDLLSKWRRADSDGLTMEEFIKQQGEKDIKISTMIATQLEKFTHESEHSTIKTLNGDTLSIYVTMESDSKTDARLIEENNRSVNRTLKNYLYENYKKREVDMFIKKAEEGTTLVELAKEQGISRERARQIVLNFTEKLKKDKMVRKCWEDLI